MLGVARPQTAIAAMMIALVAAFGPEWAMAQTAPSEVQRLVHESWTFKEGAGAARIPERFTSMSDSPQRIRTLCVDDHPS